MLTIWLRSRANYGAVASPANYAEAFQGLGFHGMTLRLGDERSWFRVWGLGFGVWGLGFGV